MFTLKTLVLQNPTNLNLFTLKTLDYTTSAFFHTFGFATHAVISQLVCLLFVWFSPFSFVAKSIRSTTKFGLVGLFHRERETETETEFRHTDRKERREGGIGRNGYGGMWHPRKRQSSMAKKP
jgi:hypothetical protein